MTKLGSHEYLRSNESEKYRPVNFINNEGTKTGLSESKHLLSETPQLLFLKN